MNTMNEFLHYQPSEWQSNGLVHQLPKRSTMGGSERRNMPWRWVAAAASLGISMAVFTASISIETAGSFVVSARPDQGDGGTRERNANVPREGEVPDGYWSRLDSLYAKARRLPESDEEDTIEPII